MKTYVASYVYYKLPRFDKVVAENNTDMVCYYKDKEVFRYSIYVDLVSWEHHIGTCIVLANNEKDAADKVVSNCKYVINAIHVTEIDKLETTKLE